MKSLSRRKFLKSSFGAAAITTLSRNKIIGANDKVILGIMGVGGRGVSLIEKLVKRTDIIIKYISDADTRRYDRPAEIVTEDHGYKPKFLQDFRKMLDDKIFSMNIEAPTIIFAGLAPVPLLYAAGVSLLTRSNLKIMDYNRFEQKWHILDQLDDGQHLNIKYPESKIDTEIAIAVPFTLSISKSQIPQNLKDKTIWVYLNESEPTADVLSSEEKLKRVLRELHDMIRNLRSRDGYENVQKVHLFIAAQASTVFKLGTEYQANIYPNIRMYHFNGGEGKYTWGISVKNGKIEIVDAP